MHPYLLISLPLGPGIVRKLVENIPESQYDVALAEDRFTVREVVAHLADGEVLFRARIESALNSPNAEVAGFDEGERATEQNYAGSNIEEQLALFEAERATTVSLLKSISIDQFRAPYIHPYFGQMVVEDQANMLVGHDMYHIEQLLAYSDSP